MAIIDGVETEGTLGDNNEFMTKTGESFKVYPAEVEGEWTKAAPAGTVVGGRRRSQKKGGRKSKKCGWGGKKSKKQQKGGKRRSQKNVYGGKKQKKQRIAGRQSAKDDM